MRKNIKDKEKDIDITQMIAEGGNGNEEIDFEKMIEEDLAKNGGKRFNGTVLDYLKLLQKNIKDRKDENRRITELAHARVYDMITRPGMEEISTEDHPQFKKIFGRGKTIKQYKFFKEEFFGIEEPIMKIVRYFHSAAMKGEESRQVLFLVGPVGAGKSSLIEKIKNGLENFDPIFVIKDCPMNEEPLHLLPRHLRAEFEKILGVKIEGDLCPICRYRLKEEHGGKYQNFPVTTAKFSRRTRRGIGVVPPVDPNNQDTSVLIGSIDISKLDVYSEDDPRAISLNGAFNVGGRGVVEFIEVFKNEIEFLHAMITATQEKMIPAPGKSSMIYFDGVILSHSNEAEWNKFKAEHTNEAILDRIVKIEVPYVLRLSEEIKIYKKIINNSDFKAHIAPHTLEMVAMFAILSRVLPTNKCDLITKLRLYNGEDVIEKGQTKKIDLQELQEEAKDEGMCGVSTRFGMKCLDNALSDSKHNCIHPISVRDAMIAKVRSEPLADDVKKKYLAFLQDVLHKEYLKILDKEVSKAFIHSYQEQAETLFQNYIDHAEAFVTKKKLVDAQTKEELDPDEKFMASIEEQIGVTGDAAKGFRADVAGFLFTLTRRGEKINYKTYEPLKEAIEKKLMAAVKELSRIITKAKTRDKEQEEKYDAMVSALIENGYCEHCCEVMLKYAANHLWKD